MEGYGTSNSNLLWSFIINIILHQINEKFHPKTPEHDYIGYNYHAHLIWISQRHFLQYSKFDLQIVKKKWFVANVVFVNSIGWGWRYLAFKFINSSEITFFIANNLFFWEEKHRNRIKRKKKKLQAPLEREWGKIEIDSTLR